MEFDFRPIREKYPKAFEELKEWWLLQEEFPNEPRPNFEVHHINGELYWWFPLDDDNDNSRTFNPRDLDGFFDKQGIYGSIIYENKNFFSRIDPFGTSKNGLCIAKSNTRSEALVAQWNKEFEILEEQLNTVNASL